MQKTNFDDNYYDNKNIFHIIAKKMLFTDPYQIVLFSGVLNIFINKVKQIYLGRENIDNAVFEMLKSKNNLVTVSENNNTPIQKAYNLGNKSFLISIIILGDTMINYKSLLIDALKITQKTCEELDKDDKDINSILNLNLDLILVKELYNPPTLMKLSDKEKNGGTVAYYLLKSGTSQKRYLEKSFQNIDNSDLNGIIKNFNTQYENYTNEGKENYFEILLKYNKDDFIEGIKNSNKNILCYYIEYIFEQLTSKNPIYPKILQALIILFKIKQEEEDLFTFLISKKQCLDKIKNTNLQTFFLQDTEEIEKNNLYKDNLTGIFPSVGINDIVFTNYMKKYNKLKILETFIGSSLGINISNLHKLKELIFNPSQGSIDKKDSLEEFEKIINPVSLEKYDKKIKVHNLTKILFEKNNQMDIKLYNLVSKIY